MTSAVQPASASVRGGIACRSTRRNRLALMLALASLISACGDRQLLGQLDESAANEVVSALRLEGLDAQKQMAGEKHWRVTIPDAQLAQSVQILDRQNLPRPAFQGLGQVFKKDSLVSTPTEERARLIHAMSQELERSIGEIDGVMVARVHPVILPHDPLNPRRATATASVLVKHRLGADMTGKDAAIRSLVASGIEGLSYDDVKVVLVPAASPGVQVPSALAANGATGVAATGFTGTYGAIMLALLALLVLSYAGLRWRRRLGQVASHLQGRWSESIQGAVDGMDSAAPPGAGSSSAGPRR